jgi:trehalose 6-phosphate phosphatase
MHTSTDLDQHLRQIATAPVLLVASDYDGTLAPIVLDPRHARPLRETLVALRELAAIPSTHVAVISGRALGQLSAMLGDPTRLHLVGSHGSEFDPDFASSLSPQAAQLRDRLREHLTQTASAGDGFHVEEKPASIAFHYRNVPDHHAQKAVQTLLEGPALWDGVFVKHGKKVLELAVVPTDKGSALQRIRQRVGATATIFFGDDITDEDAFATLSGPDIGVKVGEGESRAAYRVRDPLEVAQLLAHLCELRASWASGATAVPIERHSMLSDQRTVALVSPNARIVWLCLPRLDSPALFAELLGGPAAGYFSIAPHDGSRPIRQRYSGASMVLQTHWKHAKLTDFLDGSRGKFEQRAGRTDLIRMLEGRGRMVIEFAPRLDFGREPTQLIARDGGLVIANTHDPIVLRSPGTRWTISDEGDHQVARAEVELGEQPVVVALCFGTGSLRQEAIPPPDRLHLTERFWSSWARRLNVPDVEATLVRRSALVLKALCYGPTGAIAAAATTSLPEHIGGVRNWDYRYCWLRDAAMSATALVKLGSDEEAMHYLDWLLGVLSQRSPERLQPLYTLTGEQLGPEAEIGELGGYAGSRPVRIGNAAARQVQLDVLGPIMDLIALLIERDAPLSSDHWRLVDDVVQAVQRRWHEPDHGIWEIRRPPRHHVHSKVMCWVAVDRGVKIAERYLDRRNDDWIALRDQIADDILQHGYKPELKAFTAAYDGDDLDAAALHVGLSGLLPTEDPRFAGTVEAVEKHLRDGPTVYRYRTTDDGLPGTEGGFHLCASWLVDAYILMGRIDDARALFSDIVALAGPTGLMSEQYDPKERRALGNHPQAYSHLGIIESAVRLAQTAHAVSDRVKPTALNASQLESSS